MTMIKTQQDIISQGYQALVNSLGVTNAILFIQHFSLGQGNYTQERHQWLDLIPLEDILTKMHQQEDLSQYEEIVE
jgi:hypothetical protein